ncbi:MAG: VTT domain-containing protein [Actinobacteria bacterium]|nr:VTT domain-containing protein [Actinomycetota bacterium]
MAHRPPGANSPADKDPPATAAATRTPSRRLLIVQLGALVVVTASMAAAIPFARELQANPARSYLGLFLLSIQSGALFMLPGFGWAGIAAFAVALDNVWGAVLVGTTGQVIGEMVSYLLGATGSPWIRRQAAYLRVERWIRRWGLLAIAVIAAVPNPLFDIAGAVAGASGLGWWKFYLASWAGRLLKNLGFALAGLGTADLVRQWFG